MFGRAMYMLQESGTRVISVFRCEKRLLNWHVEWRNPRRHDSTYEVKNNNKQKKKNCNQRKKCNVQSDLHNKGPLCTVTRIRRNTEYPCIKQDIINKLSTASAPDSLHYSYIFRFLCYTTKRSQERVL